MRVYSGRPEFTPFPTRRAKRVRYENSTDRTHIHMCGDAHFCAVYTTASDPVIQIEIRPFCACRVASSWWVWSSYCMAPTLILQDSHACTSREGSTKHHRSPGVTKSVPHVGDDIIFHLYCFRLVYTMLCNFRYKRAYSTNLTGK